MAERKSTNPFYGLLVVVGIVFTVTACAYGVMTVRGLKPDEAAEASGAGAESSDLMTFLDRHGVYSWDGHSYALPVVEQGQLVGIFSERDYARKIALKGLTSALTEVKDIMTEHMLCAKLEHSVVDCMGLMTDKHIRHLPVMNGAELLGMLSIGDLVKAIMEDQQFQIQQLESYINPALSLH